MYTQEEKDRLLLILSKSPLIETIIERAHMLGTPNWYLGAGCIAQTVWNYYHGFASTDYIKDCDLVYFDENLSEDREKFFIKRGRELFGDLSVPMDIVNQARVHIWYTKYFGYPIEPYISIDHAISTWPTTATCVALTRNESKEITIHAPYGLNDLLAMTVRANKKQITQEIYESKLERWTKTWPRLHIVPWDE